MINNKYISIVTPKKTNQKIKNTDDRNKRLHNRNSIEIFVYRILVRRDKLINTYLGFVYLGSEDIGFGTLHFFKEFNI